MADRLMEVAPPPHLKQRVDSFVCDEAVRYAEVGRRRSFHNADGRSFHESATPLILTRIIDCFSGLSAAIIHEGFYSGRYVGCAQSGAFKPML